jgi:hypothetical protein
MMTEPEWLTCDDPTPMLEGFPGGLTAEGRAAAASARKLRLFACAWLRRVWHVFDDERCRRAVETAERFAEGIATDEELAAASNDALDAYGDGKRGAAAAQQVTSPARYADCVALGTVYWRESYYDARLGALYRDFDWADEIWRISGIQSLDELLKEGAPIDLGPEGLEGAPILLDPEGWKAGRREQAELVREVFGNPFRPVAVGPTWLTPTVTALAEATYEQRQLPQGTLDLVRLAVLADALEEAGCTDADLLHHLRDRRPHVRGCWAVDRLLVKK